MTSQAQDHMAKHRIESDTMGSIEVPSNVYYGAQSARSLVHFPIGRETMPPEVIRAMGILKKSCCFDQRGTG